MDCVTILINSYQPKKEDLIRSINSCLKQEEIDIKIIIITLEDDPTIKIVESQYPKKVATQKIKIITCLKKLHPGKGPKGIFYQLNMGLKNTTTRYCTYFSSNDIMLPRKIIGELTIMKTQNKIAVFSNYEAREMPSNKLLFQYGKKYNKTVSKTTLLRRNYINDCALLDLSKLKDLSFNYEKYGNTCYWDLWLTILEKHGNNSIGYNPSPSWIYTQDKGVSQHLKRTSDQQEQYYNQIEYMLSCHNSKMRPNTKYNYSIENEKIWWWRREIAKPQISVIMTATATKNLTETLELLKTQNIPEQWELICCVDTVAKEYMKRLYQDLCKSHPLCVRIVLVIIDVKHDLNVISKHASDTSRITIMHDAINNIDKTINS